MRRLAMIDQHCVVYCESLAAPAHQWLAQRCTLIECARECESAVMSTGLPAVLAGADGLIVRTATNVDRALLDAAPNLRVVGRAGVGLDNIDVAACRRRGIEVVHTPDSNTQAVVEYVLTVLTSHLRPTVRLDAAPGMEMWNQLRSEMVGERQLSDLTLGILGLGRIGKRLAGVARALGMTVQFTDLLEMAEEQRNGAQPVAIDTLFATSDVISVHVDGRRSNQHLVDVALLGGLKSEAVFINTSRGFVVDEFALATALRARPAAFALLDVHASEPVSPDSPLLPLANAWLSPHLASRTQAAMEAMSWVVRDVFAVLEGRDPRYPAPKTELLEEGEQRWI